MFTNIVLSNFKSIYNDRLELSPLTVLIGANGSGKSNLVKFFEFLSILPRHGLEASINQLGGLPNLIPKAVPAKEIRKTVVSISYRFIFPTTSDSPHGVPRLSIDHSLDFMQEHAGNVKVLHEELVFHEIGLVGHFLADDANDTINPSVLGYKFSALHEDGKPVQYSISPEPTPEIMPYIIRWLNLPLVEDNELSYESLLALLETVDSKRSDPLRQADKKALKNHSLLDPDIATAFDYSRHAKAFQALVGTIKRYDLLLNVLRSEQQAIRTTQLTTNGGNLPSVLRNLMNDSSRQKQWARIISTFGAIAPHVMKVGSAALKTGKEFVEFVELQTGRRVESWESSDGTLRALAILLSLESHPEFSTILIEEPEQNLHPWAVRAIIDHIREVIEDRHLQVILTTHSQQVLECVESTELIITSRTPKTGTRFRRVEEVIPSSNVRMGELGELWVKGLLQGVPDYE